MKCFFDPKTSLIFKYFKENFRKTSKVKCFELFTDSSTPLEESVKSS